MGSAEWARGRGRPQAVGLRCTGRGVCVNAVEAGQARIDGHVGGRFRSGLDTHLDGAARRRQGGRRTSEWASGSGGALSCGPYGSPGRWNRQRRPSEATMHKARSVLEPSQNQASLLHVAAQLYACPHVICVADAFCISLLQHRTFAPDWQGAGRQREARKVHFGLAQPSPGAVCAPGSRDVSDASTKLYASRP